MADKPKKPPKVPDKWLRGPSDLVAVSQGCWFDETAAKRPATFMRRFCRQSKGEWANKPLDPMPWQEDFLERLFGWKRPDGLRRYRSFYLEVPKKSGKSTMLSGLTLFLALADNEPGAEVLLCASTREQASIIYDEAARMVRKSPELSARLEILDYRKRILDHATDSRIEAISADADTQDGKNPSAVVFDELHRQPMHSPLWSLMQHAGIARRQPLVGAITTAGEERRGPWFDQREYSEKVNKGEIEDISHLGVVYRIDDQDDPDDPEVWAKANPSLGYCLRLDDLKSDHAKAKASGSSVAIRDFYRYRLNRVTPGASAFIDAARWDALSVGDPPAEGEECWCGLDLSTTTALTAFVALFASGRVECRFWLPEEHIIDREAEDRLPYRQWASEGWLSLCDGAVIDYDQVVNEIASFADRFTVQRLMADPWNAMNVSTILNKSHGVRTEFLRQNMAGLSAPTKALEGMIAAGKLDHGGNPILRNHMLNARVVADANGNVRIVKNKSAGRVDGAIALVCAIASRDMPLARDESEVSIYETAPLLVIR